MNITQKIKIGKIDFSFDSALCASIIKMGAKTEGEGSAYSLMGKIQKKFAYVPDNFSNKNKKNRRKKKFVTEFFLPIFFFNKFFSILKSSEMYAKKN